MSMHLLATGWPPAGLRASTAAATDRPGGNDGHGGRRGSVLAMLAAGGASSARPAAGAAATDVPPLPQGGRRLSQLLQAQEQAWAEGRPGNDQVQLEGLAAGARGLCVCMCEGEDEGEGEGEVGRRPATGEAVRAHALHMGEREGRREGKIKACV